MTIETDSKGLGSAKKEAAEKVIRKFNRYVRCIRCKQKSFLHTTMYEKEKEVVTGKFECKCGYKQGIEVSGTFVDWYREEILGEDPEIILQKYEVTEETDKELETYKQTEINMM